MIDLFVVLWTFLIFSSIFWYAFLLFYVGKKAGDEIRTLTRTLAGRSDPDKKP